jgi:2,5-diketo-D-gluconate reductase B
MAQSPIITTPFMAMPRLGLGTWPLKGAEGQAAVESALGLGYRHIDTAEMYGNEVEVGAALRASGVAREDIFLTTKVWHDKPDGPRFRAAFAACLDRLATPYVDLLLVHWPSPALDLPSVLEALAALREAGQARAVGVSNFPPGLLRQALNLKIAPLACLQVEHHVLLDQSALLAITGPAGMVLTSYTPLGKGASTEGPEIAAIAARHGVTPAQVALAYILAKGAVSAIPKAANPGRQRENLGALDVTLSADDVAVLDRLPKGRRFVNPDFAPDWNG